VFTSVIVGVGIDVNHTAMPAELAGTATSLRIGYGKNTFAASTGRRLLRHLETYYNQLASEGPARL